MSNDDALNGALGTLSQGKPQPGVKDVATLVKADIEARVVLGEKEYGRRLESGNGLLAILHAYQELLDLCLYLRQYLDEQGVEV